MHENRTVKPVKIALRSGVEGIKEKEGGVNLIKIYCKHLCTCHVPLVQL
jgi:hypothetical protein